MADNAYIHTGYRINYNNFKKAFKSMFMLHNETGNIWTIYFCSSFDDIRGKFL